MKLYVYHTPELLPAQGRVQCAVAIDVLRASTTIATALNSGAEAIQVFSDIDELFAVSEEFPEEKRLRAGERGGRKVAKCDLGNSPLDCTPEQVEGKRLFLSTTNGTRCLQSIETSSNVIVAALVNRQAVVDYLLKKKPGKVWLVGSGWEGEYSLEDTICAGAIADGVLEQSKSSLQKLAGNDELIAAVALYRQWKGQLPEVMALSSHGQRLLRLRGQKDVAYCSELDTVKVLPIQTQKGVLVVRQPGFFEKLFSGTLFGGDKPKEKKKQLKDAADKGQAAAKVSRDSQKALEPGQADKGKAEKTGKGVEKAKALQPAKAEIKGKGKGKGRQEQIQKKVQEQKQKPQSQAIRANVAKEQASQKQKKSGMTMTPIAEVFSGFGKKKKAEVEQKQKQAEALPPSQAPVKMDAKAEVQKAKVVQAKKAEAEKARAEAEKAKAEQAEAEQAKAKAEIEKAKAEKARAEAEKAKAEKVKAEAEAKMKAEAKIKAEAEKVQATKAKQVKTEPAKKAEVRTSEGPSVKPTGAAGSKSVDKPQAGTTTVKAVKAESVKVEPAEKKEAGPQEPKLAVSQGTPATPASGSADSSSAGPSTAAGSAAGGEKKAGNQPTQGKGTAPMQNSQPDKTKEEPSQKKPKDNGKKQTQDSKDTFEPPTLEDAKKIWNRLIK